MPQGSGSFLYLAMLIAIFYFLLIRPQQKQRKERQELINSLRVGQEIVTIGGMHGTIKAIHNDTLILTVAENVDLEFQKNSVGFRPVDRAGEEEYEDEGEYEEELEEALDEGQTEEAEAVEENQEKDNI